MHLVVRRAPQIDVIRSTLCSTAFGAPLTFALPMPAPAHPFVEPATAYPGDDNYSSVNHVADALVTPATAGHDAAQPTLAWTASPTLACSPSIA